MYLYLYLFCLFLFVFALVLLLVFLPVPVFVFAILGRVGWLQSCAQLHFHILYNFYRSHLLRFVKTFATLLSLPSVKCLSRSSAKYLQCPKYFLNGIDQEGSVFTCGRPSTFALSPWNHLLYCMLRLCVFDPENSIFFLFLEYFEEYQVILWIWSNYLSEVSDSLDSPPIFNGDFKIRSNSKVSSDELMEPMTMVTECTKYKFKPIHHDDRGAKTWVAG